MTPRCGARRSRALAANWGRPGHPDRGHRRRPGRAGRRGQDRPHWPVRGRAGDDPPRADFADDDFRKTNPRFTGENFDRNLRAVDEVKAIADEVGATPAQVALAWILAQGDDIAPIPGTKRVARLEENVAADGVQLSPGC
jgi:hypothetical protein